MNISAKLILFSIQGKGNCTEHVIFYHAGVKCTNLGSTFSWHHYRPFLHQNTVIKKEVYRLSFTLPGYSWWEMQSQVILFASDQHCTINIQIASAGNTSYLALAYCAVCSSWTSLVIKWLRWTKSPSFWTCAHRREHNRWNQVRRWVQPNHRWDHQQPLGQT